MDDKKSLKNYWSNTGKPGRFGRNTIFSKWMEGQENRVYFEKFKKI
ncbi:MAG: hypothetical protein ACLU4J_07075 [Butyricimonas paravirosa]